MKQTVNFSAFVDAFRAHDRQDQFSYEAKRALFDYFEQYADETGEEVDLDVIAICCEYAEDSPDDIRANYSIDADQDVIEYLNDHTSVIGVLSNGDIVYAQF